MFSFVPDGLYVEQPIERIGFDPFHHAGEEIEALAFVLDQRVFLPVAAKSDAVSQMVHPEQVVLPMMVDNLKHERLLEKAHQLRTELLFLLGIGLPDLSSKVLQQRVAADIAERVSSVVLALRDVEAELALHDLS